MSLRLELGLREKRDQGGVPYLFAPIPFINCVAFVFEEPTRNHIRRAKLVLRPYAPDRRDYEGQPSYAWSDDDDPSSPQLQSSQKTNQGDKT